jgi:hypothetical protein
MELFSETTRLYAKNYSIVEAAKSEFQKDVAAFLDKVYETMKSETTCRLSQEVGRERANRSWWIGEPEEENCPYLWLDASAAEIVDPGEITLQVCATEGTPPAQLRALKGVASREEFRSICEVAKGEPGPYKLFSATVKYTDKEPVQQVAPIATKLLLALNEAYERSSNVGPASKSKQKQARTAA